ncbi:MAG TPA: permease, partial [Gammaproteobacteria bacterium]|nr:permease [Gammaproteobacteria bacterium]
HIIRISTVELTPVTVVVLALSFVWSGFVRGGFGFGGGALMLPFALLVVDSPLYIVPLLAVQLIAFSLFNVILYFKNIDWYYLLRFTAILFLPTAAGVFGLLVLPDRLLMIFLYLIVATYAINYIFPFRIRVQSRWLDLIILFIGGYLSGSAFTGGPPIAAVAARYIPKQKLRETLLSMWVVIAFMKLPTLYATGIDLQLQHQLWLFPCVFFGHLMGMRFHDKLITMQNESFFRAIGIVLLAVTAVGLSRILL